MKQRSATAIICSASTLAFLLGACASQSSDASGASSSQTISPTTGAGAVTSPNGSTSFANGVLSTKDVKVRITRYQVIQVGEKGNEYGAKPVIAFWYKTTNLSGARVDPTLAWILTLEAYQDNDPNLHNKLTVAAAPDDHLRYNQAKSISKGRSVENAIAYELDDLVNPVDLVATEGLDTVIGKTQYEVS
jgi:hypothetical protein